MLLTPQKRNPPKTEAELLERCSEIEGVSFAQLANQLGVVIPMQAYKRKGLTGHLLELALGTDAGNQAEPDFTELSVELKTLPIGLSGSPTESTYITSIPLLTIHEQTWRSSQCYNKLKRILWVPIEGDRAIPYQHRRVGQAFLWSPNAQIEAVLEADWNHLSTEISTGYLDTLDASIGDYLQVRPKAANGKSLCYGFDREGNKVQTLPRGFYLRSSFTKLILNKNI
ncbi:DNA mismatch repair endonuclease MutH [Legionella sp. km772]|uniref:DNA mismatch repair endonuclease MutH n=1 Tax=Legionella sp. km772 TaxID=2498111 RepID=UPI000F8ED9A2|nr:DNA mismatch repair endonuclease MutH [Legionella sp. km772]RUR12963.1 DNA mismatch repair endonuclease MutH [Legionella sp. km772]